MSMIIVGKDCENCMYSIVDESNKAKIKVHCTYRDKYYYWGQCIPCEDKKKGIFIKESEQNNEQNS